MATMIRCRARVVTRVLVAAVAACVALPLAAGSAGADPTASVDQVRARVDALGEQMNAVVEQYNAVQERLGAAQQSRAQLRRRLAADQAELRGLQARIGRFAAAAYRQGGMPSPVMALLGAEDPAQSLARAQSLDVIGHHQADLIEQMRSVRHRVADAEDGARRAVEAAKALQREAAAKKGRIEQMLQAQRAELARLQASQRARYFAERAQEASSWAALRGSYTGPASGRAGAAVRFAYDQLGKPYVYGAAGPNSYDCSGLTMRAWEAGGVSLPHNAEMQQQSTRSVSPSDIQPGDLVFFGSPAYHVGIYIGGGKIIEAPHSGDVVKIIALSRMPTPSGIGRP